MASKIAASTVLLFLACNCGTDGDDSASNAGASGAVNGGASGAAEQGGAGHAAGNSGSAGRGNAGSNSAGQTDIGDGGFGGTELGVGGLSNIGGAPDESAGQNGVVGGNATGGNATGGNASGGNATGGSTSGGTASGGGTTGGTSGTAGTAGTSGAAGTAICNNPAGLDFNFTSNKYTQAIPFTIAVGDLDGNGTPDMAEVSTSSFTNVGLGIFLNQGKGTFAQVTFADQPYKFNPYTMALADLNKDGHNDLAVSDTGGVRVFFNKGDATFPLHPLYSTLTSVGSIAIGDLNNDTWPDLVVTQGFEVGVMINAGDGSFPTEVTYSLTSISQSVNSVAIGDLDHDGYGDIVYTFAQTVGVLINKQDATFKAPATYTGGTITPYFENPISANIADLNNDGKLDVVTANFNSDAGSLGIFLNKGDGTLATQVTYATTGNTHAAAALHGDFRVAIADLDGDHIVDLATANYGDGTIGIFKGVGDGTFGVQAPHNAGFFACSVIASDLNGDGQADLAVPSNNASGSGTANVFLSKCQ